MSGKYLLDASALLALIFDEPGADQVRDVFDSTLIHAVNLAEVMRKMVSLGMPADQVIARIAELHLEIITEFTAGQAEEMARWAPESKRLGLSLGDSLCLVVAQAIDAVAVTADRRWSEIQGRDVQVIRIR